MAKILPGTRVAYIDGEELTASQLNLSYQITDDAVNDNQDQIDKIIAGTTGVGNADKVDGADLSTDSTLAGNSDLLIPSQKAIKTYIDLLESALDGRVTTIEGNVNQDLKTTATPQFYGMQLYDASGNAVATYNGVDIVWAYRGVNAEMFKNLFIEIKATEAISNGDVVQYDGSVGASGQINGKPAVGSEINAQPSLIVGIATQDISVGQSGLVNFYGEVNGIDTSSFTAGTILYFDSENATAGLLTETRPVAPNAQVEMALCTVSHATQGRIKVRPNFGAFLGDLHDVHFNGHVFTGYELLKYNINTSRWEVYDLRELMFEKNGWEVDAPVSFDIDNATRTVTITADQDLEYYIQNKRYTMAQGETKQAVFADTEGAWFITLNDSGNLVASQTPWDFFGINYVWCIELYWDATNKETVHSAWEFHSYEMPGVVHRNNHWTVSTYKIGGGLQASINGDNIDITGGTIGDEDIVKGIVDSDTPTNQFEQILSPLQAPIIYRDGLNGNLRRVAPSVVPFIITGNKVQLNPNLGGGTGYGLVNMNNNKYGAYWIVVTTDPNEPVKICPGQVESDTLEDAKGANGLLSMDFGGIPIQEILVHHRIIVQQTTSAPYYSIESIEDFYADRVIGVPNAGANSHGGLDGLLDDDHPQYWLTNGGRLPTGNWNMNGYEIRRFRPENIAGNPASPYAGEIWFDTTTQTLKSYDGTTIKEIFNDNVGAVVRDIEIVAGAGQTAFDVGQVGTLSYEPGTNSMVVYKKNAEGYYELLDKDAYVETDSETITLNVGATLNDEYRFKWFQNVTSIANSIEDLSITGDKIATNTITDDKLSDSAGQIKDRVANLEAEFNAPLDSAIQTVTAKTTSFPVGTLDGKIKAIVSGQTLVNDIVNGDFVDTSNWSVVGATLSASNNILSVTANGTGANNGVWQNTNIANKSGDKIFVYSKVKVTNADATFLKLFVGNGLSGLDEIFSVTSPTQNQQYEMYSIFTNDETTGNFSVYIQQRYVDAATANGKVMEVDGNAGVFAINMTALGIESYSEAQMLELVQSGYFEGIKSSTPEITTRGKNKFDGQWEFGTIDGSGNETPSTSSIRTVNFLTVKESVDYIVSSPDIGGTIFKFFYDATFTFISLTANAQFTTPANAKYVRWYASGVTNVTSKVQLEEGTVATAYEPYQENLWKPNIELRGFNGVEDTLYNATVSGSDLLATDKWNLERNIKEYTLQASDINFLFEETNVDVVRIKIDNGDEKQFVDSVLSVLYLNKFFIDYSDRLVVESIGGYSLLNLTFNYIYLTIAKGTYVDLAAAQADLAGTVIYYHLATPTTTEQYLVDEMFAFENGDMIQEEMPVSVQYTTSVNKDSAFKGLMSVVERMDDTNLMKFSGSVTIESTDVWTDNTDHFTLVKDVDGLLATDEPVIDLDLSSTAVANIAEVQTAWGTIYRAVTADGQITFYALEAPTLTVNMTLDMEVIR